MKKGYLLAVVFLLIAAVNSQADDFTYEVSGGEVTITGYTGPGGDVVIPDTIAGLPVTSIDSWAFDYGDNLTSVTIPSSVTSIGDGTFFGCYSLTEFIVDAGNSIYSSLDGVLFNKAQTELLLYPYGKTGSYTIPSSVTSIGDRAFWDCPNLTEIIIGYGVSSIGYQAFAGCSNLTRVTIPSSVTSIGTAAFYYCYDLTGIYFKGEAPGDVGPDIFLDCDSLTVYHLAGASYWPPAGDEWQGRPTALWNDEPVPWITDYNASGVSDIGVYRPSSGIWAVRGITRAYWGKAGGNDIPVPGDYDADGTTEIGCYRPSTGYWFIKDLTKVFWGKSGDIPVLFQPNPSSACAIGVYRPSAGLWAIRDLTRAYWGKAGGADIPLPGDYSGDGTAEIGCYRPSTGYWFIKDLTKVFWGKSGDIPVPGCYDAEGEGKWAPAVYRPSSGLWAIRDVTRAYWGRSGDIPVPGDYGGLSRDAIGCYRPSTGYWFIKDLTKVYWGKPGDVPVTR